MISINLIYYLKSDPKNGIKLREVLSESTFGALSIWRLRSDTEDAFSESAFRSEGGSEDGRLQWGRFQIQKAVFL